MKRTNPIVLIVEDDHFQQELLKTWLTSERYTVQVAASGGQAMRAVTQHKPDLILLDIMMPGVNGLQAAKLLKENLDTRKIPVMVVTSHDAQNTRIKALEIGVDDFLNKPVDKTELLVRVKNLLQNRAYFKQLQDRSTHLYQLENLASIGTLINSVTNEIRKPLQSLQALIRQAQIDSPDNEQLQALFTQASQNAERIDLVVHNMGLYIKSISSQPASESCDVPRVLDQVLELLASKMEEAYIRIKTDIDPDLPLVSCSAEGLLHVLVHLLLNTYEALQDCPEPRITIGITATEEKQIIIAVCDNNIEASNMYSLITDPLFSTKLPDVCASLGLALACHFIEQSGGSISIDSVVGRGCCMRVVLKTA